MALQTGLSGAAAVFTKSRNSEEEKVKYDVEECIYTGAFNIGEERETRLKKTGKHLWQTNLPSRD